MREETSEMSPAEDDALFAHLGELVERLPQMQAAQARLDRAQAAAEILRLDRERQTCAAMLAMANEALTKAQIALEAAQAAGGEGGEEDATVEQARREVMFRASGRGFRIGPEQNARLALERALADSPFASAEEAHAATIPPDEEKALREEIASYQQDYATTLARCQQLEGNEDV